jgi:hypothetical protein
VQRGNLLINEGIREAMTDVPLWVVLLCIVTVPGLCLVLIAILFSELRHVRQSVNDTNGRYKVMLDYVLNELESGDDATD